MEFKENQLVVYFPGTFCNYARIGKIKSINDKGAFIWYTTGETASLTKFENLFPIENESCITGEIFNNFDRDNEVIRVLEKAWEDRERLKNKRKRK